MGAATAWRLASRGTRVLGLDRFHPPHELGSSHGGSRIIREMAFEGPSYVPLARRAYGLWEALEESSGEKLLLRTGALYVGAPASSVVEGSRRSAEAHGVPGRELSAMEVRRRFPAFAPEDGMVGLLEDRAGVLRAEASVAAMLRMAQLNGAQLRFEEPLLEWHAEGSGVTVRTAHGGYHAGALVLAMGAWMPDVLSPLGVKLEVERVVQHWFAPAGDATLIEPARCPVYLFEDWDGVVFYGFPMMDGAVKCAVHHRGEITAADSVRREVRPDEAARARAYLARFVPPAAGAHLRSSVCVYTNSPDGHFIVDRHPSHDRVVLLSPCSRMRTTALLASDSLSRMRMRSSNWRA